MPDTCQAIWRVPEVGGWRIGSVAFIGSLTSGLYGVPNGLKNNYFGWPYDQKYTWKYRRLNESTSKFHVNSDAISDAVQCKGNTYLDSKAVSIFTLSPRSPGNPPKNEQKNDANFSIYGRNGTIPLHVFKNSHLGLLRSSRSNDDKF